MTQSNLVKQPSKIKSLFYISKYKIRKFFTRSKFLSGFWLILIILIIPFLWLTFRELHIIPSSVPITFLDNFWFQFAFGTLIWLMVCLNLWKRGITAIRRKAGLTVEFNIAFVSTVIYISSFIIYFFTDQYQSGMFYIMGELLIFIQIGNTIEERVITSSAKNLDELEKLIPCEIKIEDNGHIITKHASEVKVGDLIIVNKGEMVPCDGRVFSNNMVITQKLWTGNEEESIYYKGSEIISGYLNIGETALIKVTHTSENSAISSLFKTLLNNTNKKNHIIKLTTKFARVFFYTQIILAFVVFMGWALFLTATTTNAISINITKAFLNGTSILVAMCPCAFGITTPLILLTATWKAYKNSVAIKNFEIMDKLNSIDTVAFDKTGTLTNSDINITNLEYLNNDQKYANILYSLEKYSNHPIAKALVRTIGDKKIVKITKIEEKLGIGISGIWNGKKVMIGNIHEIFKIIPNINLNHFNQRNIMVIGTNAVCGFDSSDTFKQSTLSAITELQKSNKTIFILTGDKELENISIKNALPRRNIYTKCKPEDKARIINLLQQEDFYSVLYVGDGLNDILAAREANAFIAVHNGSDLSLVEGDAILLNGNLNNILYLMRLLKVASYFIKISLFWAFGYNLIVVILIILGLVPPSLSALFMVGSDIFLLICVMAFKFNKISPHTKI